MRTIKQFIDAFHSHIYAYCKEHWLLLQIAGAIGIGVLAFAVFSWSKNRTSAIITHTTFIALGILVVFFYFYNRTVWGQPIVEYVLQALMPFVLMTGLAYSVIAGRNPSKGKKAIAAVVFVGTAWYFMETFIFVDVLPVNVLINWG